MKTCVSQFLSSRSWRFWSSWLPAFSTPIHDLEIIVFLSRSIFGSQKQDVCKKKECVERPNERHFSLLFVTLKLIQRRYWTGPGCSNVGRSCHWRIETVRGDFQKKMFWTLWVSVWSKHKGGLGPKPFPFIRQWLLFWCYIYYSILWLSSSWLKTMTIRSVDFSGQFLVEKWMCK